MTSNIYLQKYSQFFSQGQSELELRQQLKTSGVDSRRLSKFTQLCLLGALPLKPYINPNTAIYLASPFNSPSKFNKLFSQLMEQDLPSPLDFMANLNNAAVFQIAQQFGIIGNSLFLTTTLQDVKQPLELATLDLMRGDAPQVLVGWGFESAHLSEWEGSCWGLLGINLPKSPTQPSAVENSANFYRATSSSLPKEHYLQFGANIRNLIG
ncbi:hypothetical protein [Gallibacterium genomosp. 2]|uniref:hypothetical protein n=1 Tax=Gallibacterium genomosp. 2 TaxID=155517 RepID=UPI000AB04E71|nr:hypothetical protein [Gallibacterium genomosp. 2]